MRKWTQTELLGAEVLRCRARGLSMRQTAAELNISEDAAKRRARRINEVWGTTSAAQAVVIAALDGLLTKEDLRRAYEERRPQNGEER